MNPCIIKELPFLLIFLYLPLFTVVNYYYILIDFFNFFNLNDPYVFTFSVFWVNGLINASFFALLTTVSVLSFTFLRTTFILLSSKFVLLSMLNLNFTCELSLLYFNTFLSNKLNLIHPLLLYLALTLVTILLVKKLKLKFNYYLLILILVALFLGGWWAEQEGTWGGWWAWDPSEVFGLFIFIMYTHALHFYETSTVYNVKKVFQHFMFLSFIFFFIQYNFLLVSHNFGNSFFFYNSQTILFNLLVIYSLSFFLSMFLTSSTKFCVNVSVFNFIQLFLVIGTLWLTYFSFIDFSPPTLSLLNYKTLFKYYLIVAVLCLFFSLLVIKVISINLIGTLLHFQSFFLTSTLQKTHIFLLCLVGVLSVVYFFVSNDVSFWNSYLNSFVNFKINHLFLTLVQVNNLVSISSVNLYFMSITALTFSFFTVSKFLYKTFALTFSDLNFVFINRAKFLPFFFLILVLICYLRIYIHELNIKPYPLLPYLKIGYLLSVTLNLNVF